MDDVFQPVRDLERKQRELFDVQQSLTDDMPVLIPAQVSSTTSNGSGHAHSEGAREAGASQETS
jgi:hypothetical protein